MAIAPSLRRSGPYALTAGGTGPHDFDFPIEAAGDLRVTRLRAGAETVLALTGDYTVAGVGAPGGGSIMMTAGALAGDILTIEGDEAIDRPGDAQTARLDADPDINRPGDRLTRRVQDLRRDMGRAVRAPRHEAGVTLPGAAARAERVLAFGPSGDGAKPIGGPLMTDLDALGARIAALDALSEPDRLAALDAILADFVGPDTIADAAALLAVAAPGLVAKNAAGAPVSRTLEADDGLAWDHPAGASGNPKVRLVTADDAALIKLGFTPLGRALVKQSAPAAPSYIIKNPDSSLTTQPVAGAGLGDVVASADNEFSGSNEFAGPVSGLQDAAFRPTTLAYNRIKDVRSITDFLTTEAQKIAVANRTAFDVPDQAIDDINDMLTANNRRPIHFPAGNYRVHKPIIAFAIDNFKMTGDGGKYQGRQGGTYIQYFGNTGGAERGCIQVKGVFGTFIDGFSVHGMVENIESLILVTDDEVDEAGGGNTGSQTQISNISVRGLNSDVKATRGCTEADIWLASLKSPYLLNIWTHPNSVTGLRVGMDESEAPQALFKGLVMSPIMDNFYMTNGLDLRHSIAAQVRGLHMTNDTFGLTLNEEARARIFSSGDERMGHLTVDSSNFPNSTFGGYWETLTQIEQGAADYLAGLTIRNSLFSNCKFAAEAKVGPFVAQGNVIVKSTSAVGGRNGWKIGANVREAVIEPNNYTDIVANGGRPVEDLRVFPPASSNSFRSLPAFKALEGSSDINTIAESAVTAIQIDAVYLHDGLYRLTFAASLFTGANADRYKCFITSQLGAAAQVTQLIRDDNIPGATAVTNTASRVVKLTGGSYVFRLRVTQDGDNPTALIRRDGGSRSTFIMVERLDVD